MTDHGSDGLSDEARQLDDHLRDTVSELTGAPVRRRRGVSPARIGLALAVFAVFVAVLIGALRSGSDDGAVVETAATPLPGGGLVPTPGPSGSSEPSGSFEPGQAPADCEVGEVAEVVAEVTRTLPGSHDTTTYQGRVTFTNTGDEPVHLVHDVWLYTGPSGMDDRGWYGGPYLLEPGETREELVNLGGSEARGYTWSMVTQVAVFGGSNECLTEYLELGDAGYDAIARPVANPFPVALPAA